MNRRFLITFIKSLITAILALLVNIISGLEVIKIKLESLGLPKLIITVIFACVLYSVLEHKYPSNQTSNELKGVKFKFSNWRKISDYPWLVKFFNKTWYILQTATFGAFVGFIVIISTGAILFVAGSAIAYVIVIGGVIISVGIRCYEIYYASVVHTHIASFLHPIFSWSPFLLEYGEKIIFAIIFIFLLNILFGIIRKL